jgi:hypothetical protein
METIGWEDRHRPLVARLAGIAGIAFVALTFAPGSLGGPYFSDISSSQTLDWVKHNGGAISVEGFVSGLGASLLALFVFLLVGVMGRGLLAVVASSSMAAFMGVDWVHAGVYWALADAGRRAQADAGIIALFSLAKTMTYADGFVFGVAVVAMCLLAIRSRSLPWPLVLLGFIAGGYYLVSTPVQLAISQTAGGITGPIGVVLGLLWILAVAVVLLIKPIWGTQARPTASAAAG